MNNNIRHPLGGKPHTIQTVDDRGLLAYVVTVCELTPTRAKARDGIAKVLKAVAFCWVCYMLYVYRYAGMAYWSMLIGLGAVGYWLGCRIATRCLQRSTVIVLTNDKVSYRRVVDWLEFDANSVTDFVMMDHEAAQAEQERNAEEKQYKTYFGQSYEIALLYGGQHLPLLEVYGKRAALTVVERLQFCLKALHAAEQHQGAAGNFDDLGNQRRPDSQEFGL